MADIVRAVTRKVDEMTDELIEMCRSLVKINTVNPYAGAEPTGLEKYGQEFLKPILEEMGGRTRLFEPTADIYERMGAIGPKNRSWKDRPNLVTEFELGPGKRILINSHIDTVGAAGMVFDPFGGDVKDGRIYGRGSGDDKGGMVMGIIAIKAALQFADLLTGSIVHESVVDEECNGGGAGTMACCLEGYTADEAIVIDGEGLSITRGCQGCLTADVHIQGKSGHAAHGGVNAIDKACIVKSAIDELKKVREKIYPKCLLNLGIFEAGVHPAVVPGSARLSLNLVYSLEEAIASEKAGTGWGGGQVRKVFLKAINEADDSDDWLRAHRSEVEWVKDLLPFEMPESSAVVQNLILAYKTATGESPIIEVMPAWADAANLVVHRGIPAVHIGPGTLNSAHTDNESVEIENLVKGAKIIAVYLCQQLSR